MPTIILASGSGLLTFKRGDAPDSYLHNCIMIDGNVTKDQVTVDILSSLTRKCVGTALSITNYISGGGVCVTYIVSNLKVKRIDVCIYKNGVPLPGFPKTISDSCYFSGTYGWSMPVMSYLIDTHYFSVSPNGMYAFALRNYECILCAVKDGDICLERSVTLCLPCFEDDTIAREIKMACWTPNNTVLACTGQTGELFELDAMGNILRSVKCAFPTGAVACTSTHVAVATTSEDEKHKRILCMEYGDTRIGKVVTFGNMGFDPGFLRTVHAMAFAANDVLIVAGCLPWLTVYTTEGEFVRTIGEGCECAFGGAIEVVDGGRCVLVACSKEQGKIYAFSVSTGYVLNVVNIPLSKRIGQFISADDDDDIILEFCSDVSSTKITSITSSFTCVYLFDAVNSVLHIFK